MSSNLVSIIVPIYNVEKFMRKCIDSLVNQTYSNLEIILVNDGSLDNSGHIAKEYADQYDVIKIINKKNGGLSDARNAGLEVATGEFVLFVDSDDYLELDCIEKTLKVALENSADMVLFSLFNELVDENEKIVSQDIVKFDKSNPEDLVAVVGFAWNKLFKTSVLKLKNIRFEKGLSLVEDVCFNERVFLEFEKIEFLNEPFYHYINRKRASLIKQYHENSFRIFLKGFVSRKRIMNSLFEESQVKAILANTYFAGVRYCCSNMFFYKNSLKFFEKRKLIKEILFSEETRENTMEFIPIGFSDRLILTIAANKMVLALSIIYQSMAVYHELKGDLKNS